MKEFSMTIMYAYSEYRQNVPVEYSTEQYKKELRQERAKRKQARKNIVIKGGV